MSDTMLLGVLRMPASLWGDDHLDKIQRQNRYVQAADRIEADAAEIERLTKANAALEDLCGDFEELAKRATRLLDETAS